MDMDIYDARMQSAGNCGFKNPSTIAFRRRKSFKQSEWQMANAVAVAVAVVAVDFVITI